MWPRLLRGYRLADIVVFHGGRRRFLSMSDAVVVVVGRKNARQPSKNGCSPRRAVVPLSSFYPKKAKRASISPASGLLEQLAADTCAAIVYAAVPLPDASKSASIIISLVAGTRFLMCARLEPGCDKGQLAARDEYLPGSHSSVAMIQVSSGQAGGEQSAARNSG